MKGFVKKAIVTLVALAAFPGAVYAILAAQGRLDSADVELIRHVPLLGSILPPAERPRVATPEGPHLSPAPTARNYGGSERSDWREAVGVDDPETLVAELRARRVLYEERLDALDLERRDLERAHSEIEDREATLERVQDELDLRKARLDKQESVLADRGQIIEAQEAITLKTAAKTIAEMDSEKAAESMATLDVERAAKLLRVMDASAAAAILSEMRDVDRRKELLDRLMKSHIPPTKREGR